MQSLSRHVVRARALNIARPSTSLRLMSSSSRSPQPTTTSVSFKTLEHQEETEDDQTSSSFKFPDLMSLDPLMDMHQSILIPPGRHSPHSAKVVVRNDPSMFDAHHDVMAEKQTMQALEDYDELEGEEEETSTSRYLTEEEIQKLHIYPLLTRYVTQQTGKGKVSRTAYLVVVGNGDGLVGIGEAKGHDRTEVMRKAQENAVRNMDLVERFEKRTLWTEMDAKLGGTRIIIRPRPVGFGLAVNPYIHQVFKAAGIKDASAKVWGSRNPYQVIRLLTQMLHPGNAPLMMGNGIGGSARRLESGRGMRSKDDIQRERGRKLVNLYTR